MKIQMKEEDVEGDTEDVEKECTEEGEEEGIALENNNPFNFTEEIGYQLMKRLKKY